MIRVGIVGCGKVADKHASQIRRLPDAELVGVCDREELMAWQLATRLGIGHYSGSLADMLEVTRPHVVHITTPPASHYPLARQCMEAGCHVYVEKPFTLDYREAEDLLTYAQGSRLKITVGHETQFQPVALEMRRLIRDGILGGQPVHLESVYCYDFSSERYARALLGDQNHWVRHLPGNLLHNIISHGVGKIVEYLPGNRISVKGVGFSSGFLESIGERGIIDEARIILEDEHKTTAYFTFSSQIHPPLHLFRVFGQRGYITSDFSAQTCIFTSEGESKSYLAQLFPPLKAACSQLSASMRNFKGLVSGNLHVEAGLHNLLIHFYKAIRENRQEPISHRDILLTSRITDAVIRDFTIASVYKFNSE